MIGCPFLLDEGSLKGVEKVVTGGLKEEAAAAVRDKVMKAHDTAMYMIFDLQLSCH